MTSDDASTGTVAPRISAYHERLPYGERVSADPLVGGPFFPFEAPLTVVPLAEPILPEPPRGGEAGGEPCLRCANPDDAVIWRDPSWNLRAGFAPTGLPMVAALEPIEHMTLHSMPEEVAVSLGPVIRRVALAVGKIDGVARTHFNRWGDGSEHFHMWFLARPLGMMQLRGAMIAAWDDMLAPIPDEEMAANMHTVARAMAADGGEALV